MLSIVLILLALIGSGFIAQGSRIGWVIWITTNPVVAIDLLLVGKWQYTILYLAFTATAVLGYINHNGIKINPYKWCWEVIKLSWKKLRSLLTLTKHIN